MNPVALIVVVLVVLVLFGGWGYRSGWYAGSPYIGYGGGGLGLLLLIVLIVLLFR